METIKDDTRLLQQLTIVSQRCAQSVYDRVKARGFKPVKLVVLQINVVNNLGNLPQTFAIAQAKSLEHGFKGAVFAMMSEFSAIHIEGNSTLDCLAFGNKIETRALIDKLFD